MVIREVVAGSEPLVYERLAPLLADAYPVMGIDSSEKLSALASEMRQFDDNPQARWAVAEDDGRLAGAMKLYDFTMNVRGRDAATGGVGSVGVSLDRKRQGIARALIAWYLDWYRSRGAPFAILHSFRPDFYRRLGFGYGTPTHRYRIAPASLRDTGATGSVRRLGVEDADAILACCERVRARTNGLLAKHRTQLLRVLGGVKPQYVGFEERGALTGFMLTAVTVAAGGTANANELAVRDVHAEQRNAYAALMRYLASQRDQFARIVIETQDDAFFLAAEDPRDGTDLIVAPPAAHRVAETGLGLMYRVLDVPAALAYLAPANADSFVLRVDVRDAFYPATSGTWTFAFGGGAVHEAEPGATSHATLSVGSADLASLIVGSLDLHALVRHALATVEPAGALGAVAALFTGAAKPRCETRF